MYPGVISAAVIDCLTKEYSGTRKPFLVAPLAKFLYFLVLHMTQTADSLKGKNNGFGSSEN